MMKTLFSLSTIAVLAGCASSPQPSDYAALDCRALRSLVGTQDESFAIQNIDTYNDRDAKETRHESGSPWAGRGRTRDDQKIIHERSAIRQAYRGKNC